MDMNRGFAFGGGSTGVAIGTSFVAVPVTRDATNSPSSGEVPRAGQLTYLDVSLNTMASSPTTITFKMTRDAGGDHILLNSNLPGATQTIEAGATTATDGGVTFSINMDYIFDASADVAQVNDTLYVWLKTDTGTAKAKVRLGYRK